MERDKALDQVRADIDAIDREIQALINRRAECAQRVAEIKLAEYAAVAARGRDQTPSVLLSARAGGPGAGRLSLNAIRALGWRKCRPYLSRDHVGLPGPRKPLQVAYLGPEGTFTQAAPSSTFGHAAVCVPPDYHRCGFCPGGIRGV